MTIKNAYVFFYAWCMCIYYKSDFTVWMKLVDKWVNDMCHFREKQYIEHSLLLIINSTQIYYFSIFHMPRLSWTNPDVRKSRTVYGSNSSKSHVKLAV